MGKIQSPAENADSINSVIAQEPTTEKKTTINQEIVNWQRVRSAIEHENQLLNNRITWLLTSQGFLFAAFALGFQASTKKDVLPDLQPFYQFILLGLAVTGIGVSLYLHPALSAAETHHDALRDWWENHIQDRSNDHPPICGDRTLKPLPYSQFPFVFIFAWIVFVSVNLLDLIKQHTIVTALLSLILVIGFMGLGFMIGFMNGRRELRKASNDIDLKSHGIDKNQAQIARTSLTNFSNDWDSPEMSIYDNYDAAKAQS